MVRVLHYAILITFSVLAVSLYHIWGYDRAWRTMQSAVNAWQSSQEGTSNPQFMTLPSSLLPAEYQYDLDANAPYPFLDGRHTGYRVHPLPLELAIAHNRSLSASSGAPFWPGNSLDKNTTGKEDGSIWARMEQMDMVLAYDSFAKMLWEGKERRGEYVQRAKIQSNDSPPFEGWNRISGRMRLMSGASGALSMGRRVQYDLLGLHNERDGTCRIYGFPQGRTPDLQHAQRFLERSLKDYGMGKEEAITLSKVEASELPATWLMSRLQEPTPDCPLLAHFTLPPLFSLPEPHAQPLTVHDLNLHNLTTGKAASLGFGGVAVSDGCGWAMGLEGTMAKETLSNWRERKMRSTSAALGMRQPLFPLLGHGIDRKLTKNTSRGMISMMMLVDCFLLVMTTVLGFFDDDWSMPHTWNITAARAASENSRSFHSSPAIFALTYSPPTRNILLVKVTSMLEQMQRWFIGSSSCLSALLGCIAFFSLPVLLRTAILPITAFILYSFWVPQIIRNTYEGSRFSLGWIAIMLKSTVFTLLFLFTFIFPDAGPTMIEYRSWPYGIVAWQVVQITILFAQSMYSPNSRYLPRFLAPKFYSFQRPLTTELRATLNLCDSPTCHICYEAIRFPQPPLDLDNAEKRETGIYIQTEEVVGDDGDHLLPENARSEGEGEGEVVALYEAGEAPAVDDWAVGPCGHVWHMTCLKKWLATSPMCPLCTLEMPPLQGDPDTRPAMEVIIGM
ncbi:hypothetical protein L198_05645 [Cryptococcus wingfieldii CBS 7118]|uniref:RING-type E3 ubiquitin transferase n=1 Tax=Cryptococcus wingfieldii CBS 7118 TaxID=1295528 RepID=A0A1E3IWC0_9TREE|nr:hypothetical protein L198_05645 [Cryptococcus wingfieldii CBS 7118]ODN92848.1 hypothetical protein L198_05645 [Cryptococcus wingfieldii CBS 7118]